MSCRWLDASVSCPNGQRVLCVYSNDFLRESMTPTHTQKDLLHAHGLASILSQNKCDTSAHSLLLCPPPLRSLHLLVLFQPLDAGQVKKCFDDHHTRPASGCCFRHITRRFLLQASVQVYHLSPVNIPRHRKMEYHAFQPASGHLRCRR